MASAVCQQRLLDGTTYSAYRKHKPVYCGTCSGLVCQHIPRGTFTIHCACGDLWRAVPLDKDMWGMQALPEDVSVNNKSPSEPLSDGQNETCTLSDKGSLRTPELQQQQAPHGAHASHQGLQASNHGLQANDSGLAMLRKHMLHFTHDAEVPQPLRDLFAKRVAEIHTVVCLPPATLRNCSMVP
jgi:hypothetical protein